MTRPIGIKTTSTIPARPFRVIGVERRGGERLLSVSFATAQPFAATHLVREGDTIGDWQLRSIDVSTAVFAINGLRVRVAVP